ncbi:MAG TPA: hypothetical protein VN962_12325 [Polyangia bacterium]|nr:hypothetical protein [Polyangia bacterium]
MIELHDSVAELRREGDSVVIDLKPAYVRHWEHRGAGWTGTGRSQSARIAIGSRTEVSVPFAPREVSAGSIHVGGNQLDLIPAPLNETGDVRAQLDFVDGSSVTIDGTGVVIELFGAAADIEALPPDWAPAVDPL